MGSRKSLGAGSASLAAKTPRGTKRASQADTPVAASSTRRKKRARLSASPDDLNLGQAADADGGGDAEGATIAVSTAPNGQPDDTTGAAEGMDAEREMEAWLDFAQDHYEMVEQLPLELHRNFRLLKELDDGCIAQTEKLQKLIRRYIAERQALAKALDEARRGASPKLAAEENDLGSRDEIVEELEEEERVEELHEPETDGIPPAAPEKAAKMEQDGEDRNAQVANDSGPAQQVEHEVLGVPIPDGHGGLLVPAVDESSQAPDHPRPFPTVLAEHDTPAVNTLEGIIPPTADADTGTGPVKASEAPKEQSLPRPYIILPEIGRLAREIVRNGEEKVAVAIGAYNSIDRHIRALDSAMPAQEASILLGLRPDTMPSAYLEPGLNGDAQDDQQQDEDGDDEINIGIGGAAGGGGRSRSRKGKKKGRKGGKATQTAELVIQEKKELETAPDPLLAADPNEPRYCVCNQVSYGQMIGCDNDDCPIEWFHLGCVDLLKPPEGKWLCPVCRPQTAGTAAATAGKHVGAAAAHNSSKGKTKKAVPKGAHKRRR